MEQRITVKKKELCRLSFSNSFTCPKSKLGKCRPLSLSKFKGAIRAIEVVESRIAIKNNRPDKHKTKWEEIFKLLS